MKSLIYLVMMAIIIATNQYTCAMQGQSAAKAAASPLTQTESEPKTITKKVYYPGVHEIQLLDKPNEIIVVGKIPRGLVVYRRDKKTGRTISRSEPAEGQERFHSFEELYSIFTDPFWETNPYTAERVAAREAEAEQLWKMLSAARGNK